MIDLMAGDARLRRRLEAYAEIRLSPDLATTSRLRARVLAHVHQQAHLARAGAALIIVPPATGIGIPLADDRRRRGGRRLLALVSAAALATAAVGGAAAASGPGEALYEARLWVETIALPMDPSQRALAEIDRLVQRLREAEDATRAGDTAAAAAALSAYERIMAHASSRILASADPVAAAALGAGVARNLEALQALIGRVPPPAGEAIDRAIDHAIERSATEIDKVDTVKKPNKDTGGGPPAATPQPTKAPNERPTADPDKPPARPTTGSTTKQVKPDKPSHGAGQGKPRENKPD